MTIHIRFTNEKIVCIKYITAFFYKDEKILFQGVNFTHKFNLDKIYHFEVYDYDE